MELIPGFRHRNLSTIFVYAEKYHQTPLAAMKT